MLKIFNVLSICCLLFFFQSIISQDLSAIQYRELGPYRGGRVTTVAGVASEPSTYYFGATGGGVWKTEDYGTTWNNISDGFFKTPSIGSIAVAQDDPNIIYVGTGTDGYRSNLIEGKGMLKSTDAGETWTEIGLANVGQIGAVRIDPRDHNTVYVAAIGRAFSANPERGIYKTTDGGKTWDQILFVSEETGISDIEFSPDNPEIMYAAAWKAQRKPWTIISGGSLKEGGIYKSIDAGKSWTKIEAGIPQNLIGKIDLEVCKADKNLVYALIEAPEDEGGLYISNNSGESFEFVSSDKGIRTRPFYYTNITIDPKDPDKIYAMATGYFRSSDRGKTWSKLSVPHGDNHDMWINPTNPDLFIQANDGGVNITHNGGKSWSTQYNQPTSEVYQVAVDNQYPYWVYAGQQDNYSTIAVPSMAPYGHQLPGQGFIINTGGCETGPAIPHPTNPDIVYSNCKGRFTVYNKKTGTEQSFYVGASNMYGHNPKDLKYRFQRVSPIHLSPHNPKVIYHTSQYVHKTTNEGKTWEIISPDLTAFEADKQVISGSPITRDITGEEFYSTIYAIKESPIQEGLIWVGANDGPIHLTKDGGKSWTNVTPKNLPPGGRVDAVEPSPHNPAKAYASVLLYQLGDRKPYIYKTEDFGKSWELISKGNNGIPEDYPVRVIREDSEKEGLLFAGTEYGVFMSINDGIQWIPLQNNMPVTPITDIQIHRNDLVLSTMGRGFWVLDDINTLRQLTSYKIENTRLFKPNSSIRYRYPSGAKNSTMPVYPRPTVSIDFSVTKELESPILIEIFDSKNELINRFTTDSTAIKKPEDTRNMSTEFMDEPLWYDLKKGKSLYRFSWDMKTKGPWNTKEEDKFKNGALVPPGRYVIKLTIDEKSYEEEFEILIDPRVASQGINQETLELQYAFLLEVKSLLDEVLSYQVELEKELEVLKESEKKSDLKKAKPLENTLKLIKTKEGIYEQPMLADQIKYLYNMNNGADQEIGKDAKDRFIELKQQFQQIKSN